MTRALDHRPLSSQEEPRGTVVGAAVHISPSPPTAMLAAACYVDCTLHTLCSNKLVVFSSPQAKDFALHHCHLHCRNKPRLGGGFLYFQTLPIRWRANVLHLRFGLNNILLCVRHLITKFIYKVFWKINNIVIIGNNWKQQMELQEAGTYNRRNVRDRGKNPGKVPVTKAILLPSVFNLQ